MKTILAVGAALLALQFSEHIAAQSSEATEFECLLEPHLTVDVGFASTGIIRTISVDRGDMVKKGDTLARLESDFETTSVDLAKAKVEFGKRKVERTRELFKDNFVSEFNVDEAVTEARLAELELAQARAILARRTIKSPIEGIVVERYLSPGEFVSEEDVLKIVQIDPINVEVVVPAAMIGRFEAGEKGLVSIEQPIGGSYEAKVTVVEKIVDAASGTFRLRLEMPNPELKIPAGLKCRVALGGA